MLRCTRVLDKVLHFFNNNIDNSELPNNFIVLLVLRCYIIGCIWRPTLGAVRPEQFETIITFRLFKAIAISVPMRKLATART